jgi:tetratricopeptide (TPR) repeat protein
MTTGMLLIRWTLCAIAVGLLALGEVLRLQGDYPKAELHTRESLARYRQLNHTAGVITCLYNLAQMRQQQNDAAQAIALYMEGLSLLRDLEEEQDLALACLAGLAETFYDVGEFVKAAQVIGTYHAMQAETDATDEISSAHQDLIRQRLGEPGWVTATAQGRGLSIEELLLALAKRKPAVNF